MRYRHFLQYSEAAGDSGPNVVPNSQLDFFINKMILAVSKYSCLHCDRGSKMSMEIDVVMRGSISALTPCGRFGVVTLDRPHDGLQYAGDLYT
jgi:hypothetical protein